MFGTNFMAIHFRIPIVVEIFQSQLTVVGLHGARNTELGQLLLRHSISLLQSRTC